MMLIYELLPAEEWPKLEELYTKLFPGTPLPSPEMASVAVAKTETGEIVGFWFLQLCLHLEPAGVSPLYPEVSLHKLHDVLKNKLVDYPGVQYFLHTPQDWSAALETIEMYPIGLAYMGVINGSSNTSSS